MEGAGHWAAFRSLSECLSLGVLAVDRDAHLLTANQQARGLVERGDGLRIKSERVAAVRVRETTALHRLIADACRRMGRSPHGVLRVTRADGGDPLALGVAGLNMGTRDGARAALILVCDPTRSCEPGSDVLRQFYGMTPAEVRIATLLMQGGRVNTIAQRLRITPNTARTHLKRLFIKTEARSQSDLLRILLTGPAQFRLR